MSQKIDFPDRVRNYVPTQSSNADIWDAKETPAGAQAKATEALNTATAYTDSEVDKAVKAGAVNPRGDWDAGTAYDKHDLVYHSGTSWYAEEATVAGEEPNVSAKWNRYAEGLNKAAADADYRPALVVDAATYGNGVTDATAHIQGKLDAANTAGGGTVSLPAGTYRITAVLTYGSNTTVTGENANTLIEVDTALSPYRVFQPKANGVTGAKIRDLVIDHGGDVHGNNGNTPCISVQATIGTEISGVEFRNVQTMAVWCDSAVADPTKDLFIHGNRVVNSAAGGFSFFGSLIGANIQGNHITDCKDDAIAVQEGTDFSVCAHSAIVGNVIRECDVRSPGGSTPHGILVWGARDTTVSGNAVDKTVADGIAVQSGPTVRSVRVAVTGNNVHRAGITTSSVTGVPGNGIYVLDSDDVTVAGNVCIGSRQAGVSVRSNGAAVSGNLCRANGQAGLRISNCLDITVTGNTAVDNGANVDLERYGILLVSASSTSKVDRAVISGNRSGDTRTTGQTQTHGVFVSGTDTANVLITSNDLSGNITGAFGGLETANLRRLNNVGDGQALIYRHPTLGGLYAPGKLELDGVFDFDGPYIEMDEQADPTWPAANKARFFARDNGAGKTQLCVRFPTGAVQVLATEP